MTQPKIIAAENWTKVTPEDAGWQFSGLEIAKLTSGEELSFPANTEERAIVPLSGKVTVEVAGETYEIGGRASVFDGLGYTLYVPRDTEVRIQSVDDAEVAIASSFAEKQYDVRLVTPDDLSVESRGGGNASRQVSTPIPPDFPADRLLVVEVWTPGGNWSSYPPHKHEVDREGEAQLEEIYYYRLRDQENGWALQRAYSPERDFDLTETVRDGDVCLLPWAYHTTVAAHGHDLYYLNVLAGGAEGRTLQALQDPALADTQHDWATAQADERVPFVPRYPEH